MNTSSLQYAATLFDGRTPRKQQVQVNLSSAGLTLHLPGGQMLSWPFAAVRLSHAGGAIHRVHLEHDVRERDEVRTETLVIDDVGFLDKVHHIAPNALISPLQLPRYASLRRLLLVFFLVLIPATVYIFWTWGVPALADRVAERVPVSWEEKLGDTILSALIKEKTSVPVEMQNIVDAITGRLLSTIPEQPYPIKVHIHPGSVVNAMALPGGHILIFQGMLNLTESPEELAGVMAHEIQHVLKRHSTRGIIRALASSMLITLMVGDVNNAMGTVLELAGQMERLRFSREMENEADAEGMRMILKAGVDPQGMVTLFAKLRAIEEESLSEMKKNIPQEQGDAENPQWSEYFSTHPAGKGRVERLQQLAEQGETETRPLLPDMDWNSMHRKPTKKLKSLLNKKTI